MSLDTTIEAVQDGQRRIVARVAELMAVCDQVDARPAAAPCRSARPAASVVHHLTAA
jgi:hypothetical protein